MHVVCGLTEKHAQCMLVLPAASDGQMSRLAGTGRGNVGGEVLAALVGSGMRRQPPNWKRGVPELNGNADVTELHGQSSARLPVSVEELCDLAAVLAELRCKRSVGPTPGRERAPEQGQSR